MRTDHLRVKIKSLSAEAGIIRHEERRAGTPERRSSLAEHRRGIVRREARHSLLAYSFLRGRPYRSTEPVVRDGNEPDWSRVLDMANRFGGGRFDNELKAWRATEG